jgi:hypothetical protein
VKPIPEPASPNGLVVAPMLLDSTSRSDDIADRRFHMTSQQAKATPPANPVDTASPSGADRAVLTSRSMPRRVTRFIIELSCLQCARELGVLQSATWPTTAGRLLRPGVPDMEVSDWRRLHCAPCGGSAVPVEVTRTVVRREAPIDWLAEQPRRGRPPRRLATRSVSGDPAA